MKNRLGSMGRWWWVVRWFLIGGLGGFLAAGSAHAGCTGYSGTQFDYRTPWSAYAVSRDVYPTTPFLDTGDVYNASISVLCNTTFTISYGYASPMLLAPGYSDVYQTNVPGIGVRAYWGERDIALKPMSYPVTNEYRDVTGSQFLYGPMPSFRVQLVATGPFQAGSVVHLPDPLAFVKYGDVPLGWIHVGDVILTKKSCTVTTPGIALTLPQVSAKDLPSVGSVAGLTPFNLVLNCAAGIYIQMALVDVNTPGNVSDILSLSPDSTARGVGFQILDNWLETMYLDGDGTLYNSYGPGYSNNDGPLTMPFVAQYVRTGPLTGGSAKAQATFTLYYR